MTSHPTVGGLTRGQQQSVIDTAARLAAGTVTSLQLVTGALARARAEDALFITLDDAAALRAAAASDARRAAGRPASAIDGIPTAVKDVIDTAGLRTTMASEFYRDNVPETDATIVAALRAAGAIIIGKTNAHEFSYGIRGDQGAFGAVRNPHNAERVAGGSSSGSAAAVALGVVAFTVGSDTAGSIRLPAALCGVTGMKPTLGLLDTGGAFPLSASFDTLGYFAATPEDIALVLQETGVLNGYPAAAPGSPRFRSLPELRGRVQDPVVAVPYDTAVAELDAPEFRFPQVAGAAPRFDELYGVVRAREAYELHRERLQRAPELFQGSTLEKLRAGQCITAAQVREAHREIAQLRELMESALAPDELLISPTTPVLAPEFSRQGQSDALASFTVLWNVLGWPAVSIPVWVPGCELPQALHIAGRPGADAVVLQGAQFLRERYAGKAES